MKERNSDKIKLLQCGTSMSRAASTEHGANSDQNKPEFDMPDIVVW